MPYEYRKLTEQERAEVVRQRQERGYPPHRPPHPYPHADYYLITAANWNHENIMAAPERRTDFEARLLSALKPAVTDIFGWIILPNHYHALLAVEPLDSLAVALQHLHGTTSREWNRADGMTGRRRVWYYYHDHVIRNEAHFYQALNYIHINPVKHRYVDDPYEWPWSSLDDYFKAYGRDWLRDKWRTSPPGNFGEGWDD